MLLTKNKILAIDCIAVDPKEFCISHIRERMEHSFERHDGMIAFYAFNAHPTVGHARVEEVIHTRMLNVLREEGCDMYHSAAGARLFKLPLPTAISLGKKGMMDGMSKLGVNSIRTYELTPTIWGCTIMASPTEAVRSRYSRRNDDCCTLGDFQLFM